jgi:uncharacterized protein YbjT (DUF2867 family)
MSIVVAGASGNVGSKLTRLLLDAGQTPTVLVRRAQKAAAFARRGANVAVGSTDDAAFVVAATRGASGLFWLTPPNLAAPDLRAHQRRTAEAAAAAIRANRIERVVNLSSVGAHLAQGVGAVSGLHEVEEILNDAAANITHLRAAYFMENFLMALESIRSASAIFMPTSGTTRFPMIATRDVAAVAAERLLDNGWRGRHVLALRGPQNLSQHEAAEALSRALGRTVSFVQIAPEQARDAMLGLGMSADMIAQFLEMYDAFDSGRAFLGTPTTPERVTPTTFEEFIRIAIKPALAA